MFSDCVNFKEVLLLVDGQPCKLNCNLISLDISHDNEMYQVFIASIGQYNETVSLTDFLVEQIKKNSSVCIKIDYELKKTGSTIVDLYRVIPEKNKWLTVCKNNDNDIFVLKCRLLARNNVSFDYERVNKAANF